MDQIMKIIAHYEYLLSIYIYILFFDLIHFRELVPKYKNIFRWFFDSNENFQICFRDLLTFKSVYFVIQTNSFLCKHENFELLIKAIKIEIILIRGSSSKHKDKSVKDPYYHTKISISIFYLG